MNVYSIAIILGCGLACSSGGEFNGKNEKTDGSTLGPLGGAYGADAGDAPEGPVLGAAGSVPHEGQGGSAGGSDGAQGGQRADGGNDAGGGGSAGSGGPVPNEDAGVAPQGDGAVVSGCFTDGSEADPGQDPELKPGTEQDACGGSGELCTACERSACPNCSYVEPGATGGCWPGETHSYRAPCVLPGLDPFGEPETFDPYCSTRQELWCCRDTGECRNPEGVQ